MNANDCVERRDTSEIFKIDEQRGKLRVSAFEGNLLNADEWAIGDAKIVLVTSAVRQVAYALKNVASTIRIAMKSASLTACASLASIERSVRMISRRSADDCAGNSFSLSAIAAV